VNAEKIKRRIEKAIRRYAHAESERAYNLVPSALTSGKLYEAHVLSLILERLHNDEGFNITLINSNYVALKSSPGPINRAYPYFKLSRGTALAAELWTDVEFLTLSYSRSPMSQPRFGDFHELDILVVDPGVSGRPPHETIWLGAECKNTGYNKGLLKEILGVRRELSLLRDDGPTHFQNWPRAQVPAHPGSCLLVYSTDATVLNYSSPGQLFGIDFYHVTVGP
jgi:hypothetical protein